MIYFLVFDFYLQPIIMSQKQEISHINSCEDEIILHQILIKIINELSQLMQSVQRIVIILKQAPQMLKTESIQSFEDRLSKSLITYYIKNQDKFRVEQDNTRNSNILKRFSCRIMEFLLTYKQRAQSSESLKQMENVIRRLEGALHALQQNNNFIKFLYEIKSTFLSFLATIKKKTSKQAAEKNATSLSTQNKKGKKSDCNNIGKDSRSKTFQVEHEYQKKIKGIVAGLNARFKTVECMELDYSHFRSTYFQAKNNAEFYNEYMDRNELIQNQIRTYERDYKQYFLRKDKRRTQKALQFAHKKRSFSKTFTKEDEQNESHSLSVQNNTSVRGNKYVSYIYPGKIQLKKYSLQDELTNDMISIQDRQRTKKVYEMKNIILTASKIKVEPYISIKRVNIKNTLRQLDISRKKSFRIEQKSIIDKIQQMSKRFSPAR